MCATIRSLPFTTGAKPIFLSGFNCRARAGSHRKNLIFAPCAAYHGVFYACTFGGFCAILQKTARLSHTVLLLQLIPARGRKRKQLRVKQQYVLWLQLIPARGRKRIVHHVESRLLVFVATYPREGTETCSFWRSASSFFVAAYPREGTETFSGYPWVILLLCCNLSPRGDGNSSCFLFFFT